jgi:uncharacterized protein with PIN domain
MKRMSETTENNPEIVTSSYELYATLEGQKDRDVSSFSREETRLILSRDINLMRRHLDPEEVNQYEQLLERIARMSDETFREFLRATCNFYDHEFVNSGR